MPSGRLAILAGSLTSLFLSFGFVDLSNAATIDDITLRDQYGQETSLAEIKSPAIAIAFLGTECPLAKLYAPRLAELATRFEGDVTFLGVNSNVQDSLTEVAAYAQRHGIKFPILMDNQHELADQLEAERTPHVFLLDEQRNVCYSGRIDDQYGISVARTKPQRQDLAVAIEELLAGKPISVAKTAPIGCIIGRRRSTAPHGDITYTRDIASILNRRCVECHREGQIAPFPLTSYDDIEGWEGMIAEVVTEQRMPPWNADPRFGHFKNDARLSAEEKESLLTWIKNGCPEGDPADLPEPPEFAEGWRISEPDQIIKMRNKPFNVPATGVVKYQYFRVDPGFKEDVYIEAVEARPGNTAVVHHIIAYVTAPGERKTGLGSMLVGYAPGTAPFITPPNSAILVPKGSQLIFELHYTPNGSPQTDLSYVGIKFADRSKITSIVGGNQAINGKFAIPPYADNYEVGATRTIKRDLDVLSVTPHMHVRGKAFKYEAIYPNGEREVLLNVPQYDFNWQLRYEFAEPKRLPKGTRIVCTAHYDNSAENPNNPDPTKTVTWGDQSFEEMMIGFYTYITPTKE